MNLHAGYFGGPHLDGCNENLVITSPDRISELHRSFLEAGADIIETNSFGSTSVVLAEYGLERQARELNRISAQLARAEADAFSTRSARVSSPARWARPPRASRSPAASPSISCADSYQEQAEGLIEGGADLLLLETVQDAINCKAGLLGIERAIESTGVPAGIAVSGTIETMGTLLAGQDIEAFYTSLANRDLLWMGLNCATGPDFMTDHLRTLAEISRFPVACVPNAGLPDEEGNYNETPAMLAGKLARFVANGWVNLVGGCCGTTPAHIRALAQMAAGRQRRESSPPRRSIVSGIETLVIDEDTRPVIVGERTNVLGSRKFKRLIGAGKFEEAAEIGRLQVRRGAHILDVCLQDPDRDELADMSALSRDRGQEGESAADDRFDRRARDRGVAQAHAGQVDHQLDQSRRRRGALPERRADRAPLRRGAGGRLYRRGQAAGAGGHARAQARRSPSAPTVC